MSKLNFKTSVFIDSIGWYLPSLPNPIIVNSSNVKYDNNTLDAYIDCSFNNLKNLQIPSNIQVDNSVIRGTGLERSRSSSHANKIAAILIKALVSTRPNLDNNGLLSISKSSVASIAYDFETIGTKNGWDLTDPFGLPNSIPTALATSLAKLIPHTDVTYSFCGGVIEWFSAIENAYYMLHNNRVKNVVIICAEQLNNFQLDALNKIKPNSFNFEGASFLLLSNQTLREDNLCQIKGIKNNIDTENEYPIVNYNLSDPESHTSSILLPIIVLKQMFEINSIHFGLSFKKSNGIYRSIFLSK